MKVDFKTILSVSAIVIVFVLTSYLVQTNVDLVESYLDFGIYGMIIYFLLVVASIVLAPVSVLPVLPLAVGLWGWKVAALISVLGWSVGAGIAFLLARRYGVPLVEKFIPIKDLNKLENRIPEEHIFLTVVFLRMVVPVDGLSYFLGLFSKMKFIPYMIATVIGIIPFTIFFAYLGSISIEYQIAGLIIAGIVFVIGLMYGKRKR